MPIRTESELTPAVLAVMNRTRDPRLREILVAMVKHLHAFVREVRLSEAEFREATAVLNEIGQLQTDSHNEFVLMAGSLGVSSLVCLLNNGDRGQTETSQSLLGPFWRLNSPRVENGGTIIRSETPGTPLFVHAKVVDRDGKPIAGAEVDVWHASPVGLYENQDPDQAEMNLRGKLTTNEEGRFWFRTVKMVGYPIPVDGSWVACSRRKAVTPIAPPICTLSSLSAGTRHSSPRSSTRAIRISTPTCSLA